MPRRNARKEGGYRPYTGADHRNRSHESAHAATDESDSPPTRHPLVCASPPDLVERDDQLKELAAHCREEKRFAYDSEFIGERTYIPKLCLIQVATTRRVALVDALAELDLTPFWDLLCDGAIEKVVHAGQQDIEPVFRNTGRPAANIFDTQICAGFVGLSYPVALARLVQEVVGARLGKGLTFTQWDQRPLSGQQLRYAADDVRYLLAVADEIGKQLQTLGHAQWAAQECEGLCDPTQYGFDPASHFLRIRGSNYLSPRSQSVLRELTIWRDRHARQQNVPARAWLKDEVLLELSREPMRDVEKLNRIRGLPRPVQADYGSEIIATIVHGMETSASSAVVREAEPTPRQKFAADSLWAVLQCLCAGQSIDPNLVCSRQDLAEFHLAAESGKPVDPLRIMIGWRRAAIGQTLVDLLQGRLAADVRWASGLRTQIRRLEQ